MQHWGYLSVMAFALIGSLWLEFALRTRVLRRWRRLAISILPVVAVFVVWDLYAIAQDHWSFDPQRTTGVTFPGGLPLEELIFFVVVPLASILTLEAVRAVKGDLGGWEVGDES